MTSRLFQRIPEKYRRAVIVAPLVPLLLFLLWLSTSRAVSSGIDYFIERALDRWSETDRKPSMEQWQEAEKLLSLAVSLSPKDPRLMSHGAQLYEWGAWLVRDDNDAHNARIQRALDFHRRGLRSRPAWPYAWADFAAAKARTDTFDDEFQHAYKNAAELGPWEVGVQLELVGIGLKNWRKLTSDNRDRLLRVIENALAVQQRRLFSEVEKSQNLPLLCYALEDNPKVFDHCQANHLY